MYIISISGETRSNIELARALKGVAEITVAITCNPRSRLAAAADSVVELPFKPQQVPRHRLLHALARGRAQGLRARIGL